MQNKNHQNVRALVEGAVLVALGFVLSFVKLYELPNGGSLTPAMFPILLYGLRWGLARGLGAGFVFGLMQLLFDGAYAWGWQSMLLDYVGCSMMTCFCGFGRGRKGGWLWGTVLAHIGRLIPLVLSGGLIWHMYMPEEFLGMKMTDPWMYAFLYNGVLTLAVLAADLIALWLLRKALAGKKHLPQI